MVVLGRSVPLAWSLYLILAQEIRAINPAPSVRLWDAASRNRTGADLTLRAADGFPSHNTLHHYKMVSAEEELGFRRPA